MPHTSEQAALYDARGQGKKTTAGKLRSSRNAHKHGLRAARPPLLMGEDLTHFEGIIQSLVDQYQPIGAAEMHLVETVAMSILKQHRLWSAESAMLNSQIMKASKQEAFPDVLIKGLSSPDIFSNRTVSHEQSLLPQPLDAPHCIFSQFRECENQFEKGWQHRSRSAIGSYTKPAQKDAKKLTSGNLRDKAPALLNIIQTNPFQNPPPDEKLVENLEGASSRRISTQHRLVYEVIESENTVKVLRMWTHYE